MYLASRIFTLPLETLTPLHVDSLLNMRASRVSTLPLETMAPLHGATLTVQSELPKYEIVFSI